MAPLTISASEARANFSKLGEDIVRTGDAVTVFKNSKPWLIISPAARKPAGDVAATRSQDTPGPALPTTLTAEEQELLRIADEVDSEFFDVFEALAK
jgi:antitoxin (DNA-binding transcriptional repressor) of toxin-antitoxin stability system